MVGEFPNNMLQIILFVVVLLLGIVLAIIFNPALSFVTYEVVYFFSPQDRWWGGSLPSISYSFYIVIFMLVMWLLNRGRFSENKVLQIPQMRYIYILVFLYSITYFYAVLPEGHLTAAINYVKLILIITVAYKLVSDRKTLDYIIWGYLFGCWYMSFYIFQIGRNAGNRVEGIGTVDAPEANGIAAALAPSLVLLLYYFWIKKSYLIRTLFGVAGVFIINAIILINSRASFLGVAIGATYFFWFFLFSEHKLKHQKLFSVFILIVGFSGFLRLADFVFWERMSSVSTETTVDYQEESGSTRIEFWKSSIHMTMDYPLGNGYKGFDYYAPYYLPKGLNTGRSKNRSVHSTWFEVLTEIGFIGLLMFVLMIYNSFKATRKCKKVLLASGDIGEFFKIISIEASIITFLVTMSFMNRFRAEILYWLILYTACAYNIYYIKKNSKR